MATKAETKPGTPPVIIFHGDKGGVGKSWTCAAFVDATVKAGTPVAVVDGDPRNPDVSRMFDGTVPTLNANLRVHEGWMDVTDFMIAQKDKVIVISMPAGIGGEFKAEAQRFLDAVEMMERRVSMFWVINRLPDSVNLLNEALALMGDKLQGRVVVKNLFFGAADKFARWTDSETRKRFEASGGQTIEITELHERVVDKLFAENDTVLPFSQALVPINDAHRSPHKLSPSENMELATWLRANEKAFAGVNKAIGL